MPKYRKPDSDSSRLSSLDKTVRSANDAVAKARTERIPAALLAEVTAHYAAYNGAHNGMQLALGKRVGETAEAAAAMDELMMYISHMKTTAHNRYLREKQSPRVLAYYGLSSDGKRPLISKRQDVLREADMLITNDAQAVLDGFAPISQPTAVELQAVYDVARAETDDSPTADSDYDEAQSAVAALRPEADRLIKEVRDYVTFSARNLDAASQRRVLRNYGAQYYYTTGEKIDEGDQTAVVEEGENNE